MLGDTSPTLSFDADEAGRAAQRNAQQLVGQTVAEKYHLDRLLGLGGMGAVYAATNTWTGRRVAVKMLLQSLSGAEAVARLQQEARAASSVSHPHILDVLDMCRDADGNFLIITELLSGESLESMLAKRGRIDAYRAVQLLVPVAAALAAAHSRGVIHRDIKPDNIFLHSEGGQIIPKVIDFGISKVSDNALVRARTQTGAVFGTVDYMSPEQARGETVDKTTDIWALGVVMFRALTAQFPFEAPNVNAILIKIATSRAPLVREVDPSIPSAVAAIVDRMLDPVRSARYADFEAVLADMLAWADSERTPPLSQFYRSVLPSLRAALPTAVGEANVGVSSRGDTLSDEPTILDNAPVVSSAPTSLHWQRKSDEDLAPTKKMQRPAARGAAVGAVVLVGVLSVGLIARFVASPGENSVRASPPPVSPPPHEAPTPSSTTQQPTAVEPRNTVVPASSGTLGTPTTPSVSTAQPRQGAQDAGARRSVGAGRSNQGRVEPFAGQPTTSPSLGVQRRYE